MTESEAQATRRLQRLIAFEVDDLRGARALRDFAHHARMECEPLTSELLEAMAMANDKHERLLEFVGQRLDGLRRAHDEDAS